MFKVFMNLKKRMILLLLLQFLLILTIMIGISYFIMLSSIQRLEEESLLEDIELANNTMEYQFKYLNALSYDLAVKDDTYNFLQNLNSQNIKKDIIPESLKNTDVEIMTFISSNGEFFYTAVNNEKVFEFSTDYLEEHGLIYDLIVLTDQKNDEFKGIGFVKLNSKPFIFSLSEVKKTNGSDLIIGYLLLATEVNNEFINSLNQQYRIDLNISAIDGDLADSSVEKNKNEISRKIVINDVFDKPLFILEVAIPRKLYRSVIGGLNITISLIIASLIILGLSINHSWNKEVLTRLTILINDLNKLHLKIHERSSKLRDKQTDLRILNSSLEQHVNQRSNELLEVNKQLMESEKKFRTIVQEFPDLIFILNNRGVFLACEGGLQNQLTLPREDFLGRKAEEVLSFELAQLLNYNLQKAYERKKQVEFEYQMTIDNVTRVYNTKLIPQNNDEIFAFVSDITDSYKLLKEVEQLSYFDQLTGLFNRRFLEVEFNRLNSSRNLPFSVLALDVNGLKMINDAFGHQSGDYLLCEVAGVIKGNLRSEDIVARMGGDEFIVLLPKTSEFTAKKMMERIRSDVKGIDVNGVNSSVSIGVYTVNEDPMHLDDILKNADDSMYKQKIMESREFRLNAVLSMQEKLIKMNECEKLHSEHVYELAMKIGKKFNMSEIELHDLGLSAKYHDIGKLGIPEKILLKSSTLSNEEYEVVKRHSEIGFQIIKSADSLKHIADYVLHHHENWDGTGYPNGLKGDNIPIYSRIIRVADAYESMIHFRPYKIQKNIEEVISELIANSGKQFDPEVVEAFIAVIKE